MVWGLDSALSASKQGLQQLPVPGERPELAPVPARPRGCLFPSVGTCPPTPGPGFHPMKALCSRAWTKLGPAGRGAAPPPPTEPAAPRGPSDPSGLRQHVQEARKRVVGCTQGFLLRCWLPQSKHHILAEELASTWVSASDSGCRCGLGCCKGLWSSSVKQ